MPGTQRQNARKRRNRGGAGGAGGAGAMAAAPRQTDTKNPVSDIFVCLLSYPQLPKLAAVPAIFTLLMLIFVLPLFHVTYDHLSLSLWQFV